MGIEVKENFVIFKLYMVGVSNFVFMVRNISLLCTLEKLESIFSSYY